MNLAVQPILEIQKEIFDSEDLIRSSKGSAGELKKISITKCGFKRLLEFNNFHFLVYQDKFSYSMYTSQKDDKIVDFVKFKMSNLSFPVEILEKIIESYLHFWKQNDYKQEIQLKLKSKLVYTDNNCERVVVGSSNNIVVGSASNLLDELRCLLAEKFSLDRIVSIGNSTCDDPELYFEIDIEDLKDY